MDSKELYEKYAGRKAEYSGDEGVICGYGHNGRDMIMAVTKIGDTDNNGGWDYNLFAATVITHKDNVLGYWLVGEEDLID